MNQSPTKQGDAAPLGESIAQALESVANSLQTTNTLLAQLTAQSGALASPVAGAQIRIWEDDPFSELTPSSTPNPGATITVPVPSGGNPRLRTQILEARPEPALYNGGTAEFRFWSAEEALQRGISFWSSLLPAGATWSTSNPMRVQLVSPGDDLNAFYSRAAGLRFFRKKVSSHDIFSGESPDVVLHELGHAVLDALKPQLFNAASSEVAAFHESFGDISAILCGLQLPSVRAKALAETNGHLNVNSRLSRLAEQLGWGIRQLRPNAVDRDSLRNAANRFFYRRSDQLPPSAPATQLSSEPHSLSRVFTGAFFDALAAMLKATGSPTDAGLLAVSRDMGQILVDGIHTASITPAYFGQVAAAMVQAARARFGDRYRQALTRAFVERGILTVDSGMALVDAGQPDLVTAHTLSAPDVAEVVDPAGVPGDGKMIAYTGEGLDDGFLLGAEQTPELPTIPLQVGPLELHVHAVKEPPRFNIASELVGMAGNEALTVDLASRQFVQNLIQRGELDLTPPRGAALSEAASMVEGDIGGERPSKLSHVVAAQDGRLFVLRNHFTCGFCLHTRGVINAPA